MRPTFSIIFFTVVSGAGYGLWFLLGLNLMQPLTYDAQGVLCWVQFPTPPGLALGFVLVSGGLLSSLGHLGQPRRAWRALSQWRSSWLSREGVAAILTYVPALALVAYAATTRSEATQWLGAALALGAFVTVYCTAHIYSSLKPIRAWHDPHVPPAYLLIGLHSGALLLWVLAVSSGFSLIHMLLPVLIVMTSFACAMLKVSYWSTIDRQPTLDAGRATGLDALGSVRSFEQPHTEENYLTHEMGFVLARVHARKLRAIALLAGFLVPALLAVCGSMLPATATVAAWLALIVGIGGVFVERWLFFAEAKHAVMAYYAR
jgi:DMSO reductase anchor subunit